MTSLTSRTAYEATAELTLPVGTHDVRLCSAGVEFTTNGFAVTTESRDGVLDEFQINGTEAITLVWALNHDKRVETGLSPQRLLALEARGLLEPDTLYLSERGEATAAALKAVIA